MSPYLWRGTIVEEDLPVAMKMLSFAGIFVLVFLNWADYAVGITKLPPSEYEAFLNECRQPLPAQLSSSTATLSITETEVGGFQLICVDQSSQQEYKYDVVRDNKSGVYTVESEGSVFVLIIESSTKEVKQVKRAVKKSYEDQTTYFTADDAGKLSRVFQDESGQLQFESIDVLLDSMFGPQKLSPTEYEAFLKECMEPLPAQFSNSTAALSLTENEEGGFQLITVDQSSQQEYKYDVVRDSKSGVLTFESEGSVFLLFIENSTKEVRQVKRAVKKTFEDQTIYFTADDDGKLSSVFQDQFGEIKFTPIDMPITDLQLDSTFGSTRLPQTEYEAFLKECMEPLPAQLSNSTAVLSITENEEGGFQLTSVDQSTQQEYKYDVVRDSESGVLTFESEGSFFLLIIEEVNGSKEVKQVKRAVKKTYGDHTTYFTADDTGKLSSVFQDQFGKIKFTLVDSLLDAVFGPPPKLPPTDYEAFLKEVTVPLPEQFSTSTFSITETEEGGFQLISEDQSTQQVYKYNVVRDSKSGVFTFESEGSVFLLIIETSTKEVKQVKRAVKKTYGDHATYFTADDNGQLCSVFQDQSGQINFKPIDVLSKIGDLLQLDATNENGTGETQSQTKNKDILVTVTE